MPLTPNFPYASRIRITTPNTLGIDRGETMSTPLGLPPRQICSGATPSPRGIKVSMSPILNPFTGVSTPISIPESVAALDVDSPIPALRVEKYSPLSPKHKSLPTPYRFLQQLATSFNTNIQVDVKPVPGDPMIWQAQVNAAIREGTGLGGTKSEAVNKASLDLIDSMPLNLMMNDSISISEHIRPIVTTAPGKDILYILNKICKERNLKLPAYEYDLESKKSQGLIVCDCVIGGHRIRVSAAKKRVGCRQAALLMYKEIRQCYNVRSLPDSFYLNEADQERLIEIPN